MKYRRLLAGGVTLVLSIGAGGIAYSQASPGAGPAAGEQPCHRGGQSSRRSGGLHVPAARVRPDGGGSSRVAHVLFCYRGEPPLPRSGERCHAPAFTTLSLRRCRCRRAWALGTGASRGASRHVGSEMQSLEKASANSACTTPGDSCSLNWSGLEDWQPRTSASSFTGSSFSGIGADWVVPAFSRTVTQGDQDSSTWVGLDGDSVFDATANTPLIQIGTDSPAVNGTVQGYEAWYELLPGTVVPLFPVSPGDNMQAVITQTSPGIWDLAISDLSENVAWAASGLSYSSPGR